ncbi:MAG: hypothetical protein CL477_11555 [Acidobacteria bacterium]|jgi:hypothetical protein|nr:hypothetical protein [Acidobacteriota bacterium]MDP7691204.1 hypothetical protein [Vicinamibacterales bacterium]HJN44504.1 hypothetical protein [Vicinamibacterales bacterium]
MTSLRSRLSWLAVYAVAMAYVESAVVVYLRAIYYPDGFAFPLVLIEPGMSAIEIGREAATLVVLLGVAAVMTTDRWERFLFVALSFGIWDIFYYVWLWVFLGWPPSLFTWDILFLVPVPWIAPVLAPVIVSVGLIVGSLLLLRAKQHGARLAFPVWLWGLAVAGGCLVLLSFTLDFGIVLLQRDLPPFRWWLFAAGIACGAAALGLGLSRVLST